MPSFSRLTRSGTLALLLVLAARSAEAQVPACGYDRCALWVETHFLSLRLVEGRQATNVAKLGVFPPRVRQLERSSDSSRIHYGAFRTQQTVGALFGLASIGTVVAGLVLVGGNDHSGNLGTVLTIGGISLGVGSRIFLGRAGNHLSRSLWWYNRTLPREP